MPGPVLGISPATATRSTAIADGNWAACVAQRPGTDERRAGTGGHVVAIDLVLKGTIRTSIATSSSPALQGTNLGFPIDFAQPPGVKYRSP